jgi:hypothetical protein
MLGAGLPSKEMGASSQLSQSADAGLSDGKQELLQRLNGEA